MLVILIAKNGMEKWRRFQLAGQFFNTGLLVLNKKKQILPLGSVGEISISGVGYGPGLSQ